MWSKFEEGICWKSLTRVQGYKGTSVEGYKGTKVKRYKGTRYRGTSVQGLKSARVKGSVTICFESNRS